MGNPIKYSGSNQSLSVKKGNFWFGTGDSDKGPSTTTGFYNGVDVPQGGYVIYIYNPGQTSNLNYHSCPNDAELIRITNQFATASFTLVSDCLLWYATQSNYAVISRDYAVVSTNGLIHYLDANQSSSYPRAGITAYDLSLSSNNATLENGVGFSSSSISSFTFDGINDRITPASSPSLTNQISLECWFNTQNIYSTASPADGAGFIAGRDNAYRLIGHSEYLQWICSTVNNSWYSTGTFENFYYASPFQNKWMHVVGTYDGTRTRLYVNGQLQFTNTNTISGNVSAPVDNPYRVGWPGNSIPGTTSVNTFKGNIGATRVYNRALSDAEVFSNYILDSNLYNGVFNTSAPVVTGVNIVSRTLSVADGTWTGTQPITLSYQWQRSTDGGVNYSNISSATSATYVLQQSDSSFMIRCLITGSNSFVTQSAASNVITVENTVLDTYSTDQAITYHLSLQRGAYFGSPLINVRRVSDNVSQDFSHTSTTRELDVAAIQSFVGGANRITRSQDFGVSPWQLINASIVATNSVAPDSTNTASTLQLSGQFGVIQQGYQGGQIAGLLNPTGSSIWCMSVYVKKVNKSPIRLVTSNFSIPVFSFNYDAPSGNYESVGNGWFRIWATMSATQSADGLRIQGDNNSASGDQHLIWGAQLNPGSTPSTYQRTFSDIGGTGRITTWYDQSTLGRNATQTTVSFQYFIAIDGIVATQSNNEAVAKSFYLTVDNVIVVRQGNYSLTSLSASNITIYRKVFVYPGFSARSALTTYFYHHTQAGVGFRDPGTYNSSLGGNANNYNTFVWNKTTTGLPAGQTANGAVYFRQRNTIGAGLTAGTLLTDLSSATVSINGFNQEFFNTFNTEDFRGQIVYTTSHNLATMQVISLII